METKVKAFMNDELNSNEITKDILVAAYMNEYPKNFLYDYPSFFLKKMSNQTIRTESTQKAIDDVTKFLETHKQMDDTTVEKFFNLESVTVEHISYVGW